MSAVPILEILAPGAGLSIQDLGRIGWKRYGIPQGVAMDADSARKANLLVGNEEVAPVLEFLFTGARLRVLSSVEAAITGAEVHCGCPQWRNFSAEAGREIAFGQLRTGVWTYLAVRGGFAGPRWFGSASAYPRAGLGEMLAGGVRLNRGSASGSNGISSRFVPELVRERFDRVPVIRIWPGPEWEYLTAETRELFLREGWRVSRQSDRVGYRLEGKPLRFGQFRMPSAPVLVGTIQVPPSGLPIVLLRDGPTVGGYPRLGVVDPSAISRFVQCAPESEVRFQLAS